VGRVVGRPYPGRVGVPVVPVEDARHGGHQHHCLAYGDSAEFDDRARGFLADGLARGLRVRLVVGGDGPAAAARMGQLGGRADAVEVQSLSDTYGTDQVVDPPAQVRAYAAATDEAVAAGFAGLRVAADVTSLVRTPAQLDAFARYEHLVDRYMTGSPFSALCAYSRPELGAAAVADLACMHPRVHPAGTTAFRLHAAPSGAAVVLVGEVDLADRRQFDAALERSGIGAGGGEVVLDATRLAFVDHRSLLALAEVARRRSATVVLRTRLRTVARLVELLGITAVRVETVA
jgi:anti-anti-sigma regulatory factor